jgi:hypothetical protein
VTHDASQNRRALSLFLTAGLLAAHTTSITTPEGEPSTTQPTTFPTTQKSDPLAVWDSRLGEYVDQTAP